MGRRKPSLSRASVGAPAEGENMFEYSALGSWEAGESDANADVMVAVVSETHLDELRECLGAELVIMRPGALFVAPNGNLLAFWDGERPEWLAEDLEEASRQAPDPARVDRTIEDFVSERFGPFEDEEEHAEVQSLLREFTSGLARVLAADPSALRAIEWRQLEQVLAEVFAKLGFAVVLTRPAKDGGKDLILSCTLTGEKQTYVVELKHWIKGDRVGSSPVRDLLQVVVKGGRRGGLLIATGGFTSTAFVSVSELDRRKIHGGTSETVFTLCKLYCDTPEGLSTPDVWTQVTQKPVEN